MAFYLEPLEPLTPLKEMAVTCPKSQVSTTPETSSMPLIFLETLCKNASVYRFILTEIFVRGS